MGGENMVVHADIYEDKNQKDIIRVTYDNALEIEFEFITEVTEEQYGPVVDDFTKIIFAIRHYQSDDLSSGKKKKMQKAIQKDFFDFQDSWEILKDIYQIY